MKFLQWLNKVSNLCLAKNYRDEVFYGTRWDDYFKQGWTPKQALEVRMRLLIIGELKETLAEIDV